VVLAGTLVVAPAVAVGTCTSKPPVLPVDQLQAGMKGTGYTVVKGRTPSSFDVEILGVLKDGIAPGLDFILVKVSGPVIDQTGGIAAGFSGSPVYIGGSLVGAVAYGFFLADHTIGGVTPAEPMLDILDYPPLDSAALPQALASAGGNAPVRLSPALRQAAAEASGQPAASFTTARHLKLPVAVSGLNDRGLDQFQSRLDEFDVPVTLYRAGAVSAPQVAAPSSLERGSSVAAAFSYGDITFAGVGTATVVCGSRVLAFGHPFFFSGPSQMGMSAADVLTVVRDPSEIEGPFKLAQIAETIGTVDQDRLAGIAGTTGELPPLIPVIADITNPDIGKSRVGETDVVQQEIDPFLFPFIAEFHLLLNLDVTFDRIGGGTSRISWVIHGTRESGEPFEVARENMYFSDFDVSIFSIFEFENQLFQLAFQNLEQIQFTGIDIEGFITQHELLSTITKVKTASSLQPRLKARKVLRVKPGDTIRMQVTLDPAEGEGTRTVDMQIRVPRFAPNRGPLVVRGGQSEFFFFFFGEEGGEEEQTFDELLADLESGEHSFDLVATLFGRRGEEPLRKVVAPQDDIIQGQERIRVVVVRKGGKGGGGGGGGKGGGGVEPTPLPAD
jgi:hypothetical protein